MHTETKPWVVHHGDCLQVLKTLPDNSVDSVVTDPPYGLSFMGKKWDYDVPSEDIWRECLRVLKPGGHLLAFAGTRTQHRMAVRIEDAGFEIRDMIAWVYGSGFPKSLDVSKAIDKCNGEKDRILRFTQWYRTAGVSRAETTKAMIAAGHISENGTMAGHYFASSQAGQPAIPTAAIWKTLRPLCASVPAWVDELVARIEAEREVVGTKQTTDPVAWYCQQSRNAQTINITAPATEAAKQWHGWGTALKPALEPITVARKPLIGTVADNVLHHGTGALNVDGCRVGTDDDCARKPSLVCDTAAGFGKGNAMGGKGHDAGRWPANLIHDGSEEVVELFPQSGNGSGKQTIAKRQRSKGWCNSSPGEGVAAIDSYGDTGSAARFFACFPRKSDYGVEWQDQNPQQPAAQTATSTLSLQEQVACIAQKAAAIWPSLGAMQLNAKPEPFTPVTPSESKAIDETAMRAIATIANGFLRESQQERHTPCGSLAVSAVTLGQTGITTITVSLSRLGGFVGSATSSITPLSLGHGEAGCRIKYCAKASKADRDEGCDGLEAKGKGARDGERVSNTLKGPTNALRPDSATISRNHHPTVKPTDLMRYLCRLVTPPGGVVLDPFTGSGSTGKAAMLEGFRFVGIEREAEYVAIAQARIGKAADERAGVLL
jgi:DNA modification methylase